MKITLFILAFLPLNCFSQSSVPWERPLRIAWSTDGTTFGTPMVFQDSSGVPSAVRWKGDTMVCVFQWFRKPVNSVTWDKVAVKFSYNAGQTWTQPVPIIVNGIPAGYQRPFDPTLAVVSFASIRVYFSSSPALPVAGLDATINTYSAISTDGIHYTFETNPRFDHPTNRVIDPAVIYFNSTWHYAAPAGAPQDGAYHATGSNGVDFVQQANYNSDMTHNWTGNFMINSNSELRFYGSGPQIWYNRSADGYNWQGYTNTNLRGGDPSVTRISSSSYCAIYVGEPYITAIEEMAIPGLVIYPNPFTDYLVVQSTEPMTYHYTIHDLIGQTLKSGNAKSDERISTTEFSRGVYLFTIETGNYSRVFRLLK